MREVPLNQTAATQFLFGLSQILQFQTTLDVLKNPPPSYQRAPVDILGGLDDIRTGIENSTIKNQYDFERSIGTLIGRAYDGHFSFSTPLTSEIFSYRTSMVLVSLANKTSDVPQLFALGLCFPFYIICRHCTVANRHRLQMLAAHSMYLCFTVSR